jgi:predicted MPP superfamily phosphohydrolase
MMSALTARRGIYAVLGNHDQRDDPELLRASLEGVGIPVLMNKAREIEPGFWLGGVDDLLEGKPDLTGTLAQIPEGVAAILLSHNPNALNKVSEERPLFILSGHTHGAQIVIAFPSPYMVCRLHLGTRYVHGWYERGKARLYVNRGIGVTGAGFFARRYKCPPEITLFTLKPA